VSEWADAHRVLAAVESAEPGAYRTLRTPYVREIADALSVTSPVRRVVVMKGAQLGFTLLGTNWIGYIIHHAPAPTLMVQPTVEMAKRVSKQRIGPMIEATPVLQERVKEPRSRDSGNTIFIKEFPGGVLITTGANSAAGLRSMPIRYLFLDEVDAYPGDVDGEGDPIALAEKRQSTFPRRKTFLISTPTIKGLSRIEKDFLQSDQRRYFVPCPACGAMDWIRWANIRWEDGNPQAAMLKCIACDAFIDERHKTEMLARGEWRPTATGDGRTRGYHLSALYAPIGLGLSWGQCAAEFLETKGDVIRFKTWCNTVLGETWEERGEGAEPDAILARAQRYEAEVPNGVGILVASVDVQGDRLECQVKGYGAAEESWLIAFSQFHGDPGREPVWFELDKFLARTFEHQSGRKLKIECVTVDSGGHHTDQVYKFCKARHSRSRRIFAVRGGSETGKPIVGRPTTHNRYRAPLFTLCVDSAKETIYSRLRIESSGPGYMHLPEWTDAEYVAQLTAEKGIKKYVKGRGVTRQWIKTRERNEALDLEVYCLAALYILGPTVIRALPELAAALSRPIKTKAAASDESQVPRPRTRPRTGKWIDGWRGG
jgi:phage terminase large subunit GpA-like protein